MRWGVPEEASDNHSTADLCVQEIRKCQEVSVGPCFVVRPVSLYFLIHTYTGFRLKRVRLQGAHDYNEQISLHQIH